MNMTHRLGRRDYGRTTRIVWAAVAALIVLSILAFAALWAMGIWPASLGQNASARGIDADAARYNALGQSYAARGGEADAARWAALGRAYAKPYTDVSLFYAERMRAQAHEDARLASNPELALSRSYASSTAASGAAAKPYTDVSLFYVERMRAQAREARENGILAANPELMFARREYRTRDALTDSPEVPTCSVNC